VFGVPCSLLLLLAAWWVLVALSHPFHLPGVVRARDLVRAEWRGMGPLTVPERRVAAACALMLPVGTAPNAIVYGSGRIRMRDMMRAGFVVNILAWGVIIAVSAVTLRWLV
jgi:di/tricarboxylate transporter